MQKKKRKKKRNPLSDRIYNNERVHEIYGKEEGKKKRAVKMSSFNVHMMQTVDYHRTCSQAWRCR